jgi:hypothetical protein
VHGWADCVRAFIVSAQAASQASLSVSKPGSIEVLKFDFGRDGQIYPPFFECKDSHTKRDNSR